MDLQAVQRSRRLLGHAMTLLSSMTQTREPPGCATKQFATNVKSARD